MEIFNWKIKNSSLEFKNWRRILKMVIKTKDKLLKIILLGS